MTGWVKRRSTRTTTVLFCLSLTTTPWSVRFGISLLRLRFRARGALRLGCWLVLRRRPRGALERRAGLDARDIAADQAHARGVLELAGGPLETQVEALLLELESLVVELVDGHGPQITRFHRCLQDLFRDAFDEARLDRQLGRRKLQRLAGERLRHAVDLKQDAPRLDAHDPQFRRALARAHAHFQRLLRHRHVRIDADPDPAGTLHVTRERAPRRLDLARGDALRLERLEPELAERKINARGRDPLDAAFVCLAEFGPHRLQHGFAPFLSLDADRLRRVATRTSRLALGHLLVLRHAGVL